MFNGYNHEEYIPGARQLADHHKAMEEQKREQKRIDAQAFKQTAELEKQTTTTADLTRITLENITASEKQYSASKWTSITAIAISIIAGCYSLYSSTNWQNQQIPVLESLNKNLDQQNKELVQVNSSLKTQNKILRSKLGATSFNRAK